MIRIRAAMAVPVEAAPNVMTVPRKVLKKPDIPMLLPEKVLTAVFLEGLCMTMDQNRRKKGENLLMGFSLFAVCIALNDLDKVLYGV